MVMLDGSRVGSCAWLGTGRKMAWESPVMRQLSLAAPRDGAVETRQHGAI
jgi:hypothetical protein